MVEKMASESGDDPTGRGGKLVPTIPSGGAFSGVSVSVHDFQLRNRCDEHEILALFLGLNHRNDTRSLHLHLQVCMPSISYLIILLNKIHGGLKYHFL